MLLGVFALGLAVDLGSKSLTFRNAGLIPGDVAQNQYWIAPPGSRSELLPFGLLDLQLVINHGAVFGLGANQRFFFIAFTTAAMAVGVAVFGWLTRKEHRLAQVAIAMVLAGGMGNLYDRIVYGVVRDFLHMLPGLRMPFEWTWPGGSPEVFPWVFNVADMLLLFGMILVMLHMRRMEVQRHLETKAAPAVEVQ